MLRSPNAQQILNEAGDAPPGAGVPGFVAVEYYASIMNRTFAVLVCADGFYGWKVSGPVTAHDHDFFRLYQEMIDDPDDGSLETVQKLAGLRGDFFIPRADLVSVELNTNPKWASVEFPIQVELN